MNNQNNYDFFFWLGVIANLVQLESYELLLKDANNNDIMNELREQDTKYLETIIRQNTAILERLESVLERR